MRVTSVPYRSSNLAIPTSPFSPITPVAINISRPSRAESPRSTSPKSKRKPLSPPPQSPLQWLWQCHICKASYPLGVTRRCLVDGHYFCSGVSYVKSKRPGHPKVPKRGKACTSEFDYQGWKRWGDWRRADQSHTATDDGRNTQSAPKGSKKNCWDTCDFPSECRWGNQLGVQFAPVTNAAQVTAQTPSSHPETPPPSPPTTDITAPPYSERAEALSTLEGMLNKSFLQPQSTWSSSPFSDQCSSSAGSSKDDFWSALMISAKRRKSTPDVSPLHELVTMSRSENIGNKGKYREMKVGLADNGGVQPRAPAVDSETDDTEIQDAKRENAKRENTRVGVREAAVEMDKSSAPMEGVEFTGNFGIKRDSEKRIVRRASIRSLFQGRSGSG